MELIIGAIVILIGFISGSRIEKKHIKNIIEREKITSHLPFRNTGLKEIFPDHKGFLVYGSVVISQDAFKKFISNIVSLVGGRVTVYESLLERARREALLRVKEKAIQIGAKELINLRMETSTISTTSAKEASGSVEIFCYATALK